MNTKLTWISASLLALASFGHISPARAEDSKSERSMLEAEVPMGIAVVSESMARLNAHHALQKRVLAMVHEGRLSLDDAKKLVSGLEKMSDIETLNPAAAKSLQSSARINDRHRKGFRLGALSMAGIALWGGARRVSAAEPEGSPLLGSSESTSEAGAGR